MIHVVACSVWVSQGVTSPLVRVQDQAQALSSEGKAEPMLTFSP